MVMCFSHSRLPARAAPDNNMCLRLLPALRFPGPPTRLPVPPPVPAALVARSRGLRTLRVLIAMLSIACIYLSGLVVGGYLEQQKTEPGGAHYVAPVPSAPPVRTVQVEPFHDPYAAQEQKDCAQFVGNIQNLEAQRHTMMWAHSVAPSPPENPPRTDPLQTLPIPGVEMWQLQTEAANLRKMSQDLERVPINGACYGLRNDYRQYLVDIEQEYQKLIRALEIEASDPPAAQKLREEVYSGGIERLHDDAFRAESSLMALCTIKSIPRVFHLMWRTRTTE